MGCDLAACRTSININVHLTGTAPVLYGYRYKDPASELSPYGARPRESSG